MPFDYQIVKEQIIAAGQRLYSRGWAPATSGNYSHRIDEEGFAVTVSGNHKGMLTQDQVMRVDYSGQPLEDRKPSAETLLHCVLYELLPDCHAILHTHSINSTVLSMQTAGHLVFSGYELLKAFPGITTHDVSVEIPVFDNTQDMTELAPQVAQYLGQHTFTPAYIIRGHGIYAWGKDMAEAERVTEALEFLLACEMEKRKMNRYQEKQTGTL